MSNFKKGCIYTLQKQCTDKGTCLMSSHTENSKMVNNQLKSFEADCLKEGYKVTFCNGKHVIQI